MKYTFFHDSYVKGHRDEPLRPSPSMSVDFLPTANQNGKHRIATAVMNENIKIWEFVDVTPSDTTTDDLSLSFQLLAELTPTSECKTVNIVRWSPDGLFLATGCSSGHVLIWRKQRNILQEERQLVNSETNEPIDSALQPSEVWKTFKTFKNHDIDIMDLSWSPPLLNHASTVTSLLTVVSFDNKISVVDVTSGETVQEMRGQQKHHKSPVQGVSWDPWGGFFATQSCDKTVRIYNCDQKLFSFQKPPTAVEDRTIFTCNNVLKKCEFSEATFLPKEKCTEANIKRNFALFREESSRILYRRLDVSPDGSLLVVPAGQFPDIKTLQETAGKKLEFKDVIFTFSRNNWKTPKIVHQGLNFPSIGIRFSPVLYKKTKYNQDELPYWMMFASISKDRLIVYSTEHQRPLYVAHLMHQEFLTDISWSQCGRLLFVSSWDGYFSVYRFEQSEIPEGYSLEKYDLTCDSENSTCHSKMLENLKRAFTLKSQNLTQLFSSHKKEDQEPVKINVLSVKRKQQN